MPTPIRYIVFDLGGVLIRICRSWQEACEHAGLPVRDEVRLADLDFITRRHGPSDQYMSGKLTCAEYAAAVAEAVDNLYSPHEIVRLHRAWTLGDEPGAADLIQSLNDAGLTTACLSNTNHTHWQILTVEDPSPAIALLRHTLVSHHLGHVKPDEAIYRAAETALGAAPDQILFFDDVEHNIDAARARGWHARAIDHARPTIPQVAEHLATIGLGGVLRER